MEDLKCITFDDDIDMDLERKLTFVNIKIGNKEFGICLNEKEAEKEAKKYGHFADCQYSTIETIAALKKLTKFLEAGINIDVSKSLIE